MSNKHKKLRTVAIVCSLAALLAGYFFWMRPKYNQAPQINASTKAPEVTVITLSKQKVQQTVELPARVAAVKISDIRPQIEGVIRKVKFSEGSFVKAGQQLYQIDSTIYQSASESADRNLKTLHAKRDRYQALLEQDAVSKQEFDDVEAAYAQAKADSKKARMNFNYTKVLAPISGYIGKTNFTEGALMTPNQTDVLTTIAQLDPIYVDMVQPTKDMLQMGEQKGAMVSVATDDPNYKNEGRLKLIEVFADEGTDSVRLRALFPNKSRGLIPGMFVTAKVHLKAIEAVLVPQRVATRMPDGSLSVWVVQGDIVKPQPFKAEKIFDNSWIVQEGLNDGDVVVYEGYQKLADGAKITAVPLVK